MSVIETHHRPTATEEPDEILLHATGVSSLMVCPRLFYYENVRNFRSPMPSEKLDAGGVTHKALEFFYRTGADPAQVLEAFDHEAEEATEKIRRQSGGELSEEGVTKLDKERLVCRKSLAAYLPWAVENDSAWWKSILYVEQRFKVPVLDYDTGMPLVLDGKIVCHVGTFDLVVEDDFGFLWVVDHKTAKSFPSETEMQLNLQFGMYALAARYLWPDRRFAGVIYNGLKKVDPGRATTATYWRQSIRKNDAQLANLGMRLSTSIARTAVEGPFDPHPGAHCGWRCPYVSLCLATERGDPWEDIAARMFVVRSRDVEEVAEEGGE